MKFGATFWKICRVSLQNYMQLSGGQTVARLRGYKVLVGNIQLRTEDPCCCELQQQRESIS